MRKYTELSQIKDKMSAIRNKQIKKINETINLVASSSANLSCKHGFLNDVWQQYTIPLEGRITKRYYSGLEIADEIETEGEKILSEILGFQYTNVQPLSGSSANWGAYGVLSLGDKVLAPYLNTGGHLTHISKLSTTSKLFEQIVYKLDYKNGNIDFDAIDRLAQEHKPKMFIVGYSAWPFIPDFHKAQEIAKKNNMILMCDIAHILGFVAVDNSILPKDDNVIVTSSSFKTLAGPKGGFCATNNKQFADKISSAIFPGIQGTNDVGHLFLKLQALMYSQTKEFEDVIVRIRENSKILASTLYEEGMDVVCAPEFTNTHMQLARIEKNGLMKILDSINISSSEMSGIIRFGVVEPTQRGLNKDDIIKIGKIIASVYKEYISSENISKQKIEQYRQNVFSIAKKQDQCNL